ncbi:hypothetical protein AAFC00_007139 [Neodothiora populina]|uniref:Uncharacterized protein n=1 Tax=Neodothiora populina TaxID=2781224 RepID=A0ABR3PHN8_9PEZI
MFYDLNIEYNATLRAPLRDAELSRTLSFVSEMGYNCVALNHTISGKIPADISCVIPDPLPFASPASLTILRRCTLVLSEAAANNRVAALSSNYDILAVRPVDEKTFQHACNTTDCDVISLDLSQRLGYHFKFKTVSEAIKRGVRFEVCYSQGVTGEPLARRNLISNVTQLIRATRGRGLIVSSEAKRALGCRAPWDVVNLVEVWGLPHDRSHEAISKEARSVVVSARLKRESFRGVVTVVYGGQKPAPSEPAQKHTTKPADKDDASKKRKAENLTDSDTLGDGKPISKREQKRRAKAAVTTLQPTIG